jgi:hypothetical protein
VQVATKSRGETRTAIVLAILGAGEGGRRMELYWKTERRAKKNAAEIKRFLPKKFQARGSRVIEALCYEQVRDPMR